MSHKNKAGPQAAGWAVKGSLGYLLRQMGKQVAGFKERDDNDDHAPS